MYAYMKVYSDLLKKINDKTYPAGALLPPEPELEKIYGVSRTTVRRAMSVLVNSNRVRVQQGFGTVVLDANRPSDSDIYRFGSITKVTEKTMLQNVPAYSHMSVDIVPATAETSEFFDIPQRSDIYRIQRSAYNAEGAVLGYLVNFLPCRQFPDFDRFNNAEVCLYDLLRDSYGVIVETVRESFTAVSADFVASHVLGVREGSPLVLLRRYGSSSGSPVEYTEYRLMPRHYELSIHMELPQGVY